MGKRKPRTAKSKLDGMENNWRSPSNPAVTDVVVDTSRSPTARNWREVQGHENQQVAKQENGNVVDAGMPDKNASVQQESETVNTISERKKQKLKKRAKWQRQQEAVLSKWGRDDPRFFLNGEFREDCPVAVLGEDVLMRQKEVRANHLWNIKNLDNDVLPKPLVCPACNFRTLVYLDMSTHLHKKILCRKPKIYVLQDSCSALEEAETDNESTISESG